MTPQALPGPLRADGTRWIGVVRDETGKIVKTSYHSRRTPEEAIALAREIIWNSKVKAKRGKP